MAWPIHKIDQNGRESANMCVHSERGIYSWVFSSVYRFGRLVGTLPLFMPPSPPPPFHYHHHHHNFTISEQQEDIILRGGNNPANLSQMKSHLQKTTFSYPFSLTCCGHHNDGERERKKKTQVKPPASSHRYHRTIHSTVTNLFYIVLHLDILLAPTSQWK